LRKASIAWIDAKRIKDEEWFNQSNYPLASTSPSHPVNPLSTPEYHLHDHQNTNPAKMKTSQILAAGALLAGYAQACTRIRVDNVRASSPRS
jgi:hypothetical protein